MKPTGMCPKCEHWLTEEEPYCPKHAINASGEKAPPAASEPSKPAPASSPLGIRGDKYPEGMTPDEFETVITQELELTLRKGGMTPDEFELAITFLKSNPESFAALGKPTLTPEEINVVGEALLDAFFQVPHPPQPPQLRPGEYFCPGCKNPLSFYLLWCPICQYGQTTRKPDGKDRTHAEACALREGQIAELQQRIANVSRLVPPPGDLEFAAAYNELCELFWRNHKYEEAINAGLQAFDLEEGFWRNHTVEQVADDTGVCFGSPNAVPSYYLINALMRVGRGREAVAKFERLLHDPRLDKGDRRWLREQLAEAPYYEEKEDPSQRGGKE